MDEQEELFPDLKHDSTYGYGDNITPTYQPDSYMSQPENGLVSEVHSKMYKEENGNVKIVTTKRKFYGDGDYQDSQYFEVL